MLDLAVKAGIPVIGVVSDDPIHFADVVLALTGRKLVGYPTGKATMMSKAYLYTLDDPNSVTVDHYERMQKTETSMVLMNPKPSHLVFDAGPLMPPDSMIAELVHAYQVNGEVVQTLKGLSLKAAKQLLGLVAAKYGAITPQNTRSLRHMMTGITQGLTPLSTELGFYSKNPQVEDWLTLNREYFLSEKTLPELRPRGLLLAGPPGTGKTLAATYIANTLDVPLYKMDVTETLGRYIGESEARVGQALQMIERESPCVMLMDEVEKLFDQSTDNPVIRRILAQFLWWLQMHRARVLTTMTTNKLDALPPELYREGRLDAVLTIGLMSLSESLDFGVDLLKNLLHKAGKKMTTQNVHIVREMIKTFSPGEASKAHVTKLVTDMVKSQKLISV